MTARTKRLARKADGAASWRGHSLGPWTYTYHHRGMGLAPRATGTAACTVCQAGAYVDSHPPPNGIEISGEAVAVGCPAPREELR
jgi:hypothetical protein